MSTIHTFNFRIPPAEFTDFANLKHPLNQCGQQKAYVIVEGTVAKLARNSVRSEKAGIEGAAQNVMTTIQIMCPIFPSSPVLSMRVGAASHCLANTESPCEGRP